MNRYKVITSLRFSLDSYFVDDCCAEFDDLENAERYMDGEADFWRRELELNHIVDFQIELCEIKRIKR